MMSSAAVARQIEILRMTSSAAVARQIEILREISLVRKRIRLRWKDPVFKGMPGFVRRFMERPRVQRYARILGRFYLEATELEMSARTHW